MKKLLLAAMLLAGFNAVAWNVSTAPTAQHALIEEYTGFHCVNCPDGHRMAAAIKAMHPEQVHVVAIHASGFAEPRAGEPDYRTDLGEQLCTHFNVGFFPAGVINRRPNSAGEMAQGRSTWGPSARYATLEQSPVNLWAASSYDADTRTLSLEVEGYVTADVSDLRLNAWLLQSEILGPQTGGQLGVEYPHRHMLRGRLNDSDLGDPVADAAAGQYFKRTFSYQLPADVRGVAVNPANIELLVFATQGDANVCQVTDCRPTGTGSEQTFAATSAVSPIPIAKNYALDYLEVTLTNYGGQPLTTADFNVTLNGQLQQVTWTGEVAPHSSQLIRLPLNGSWDSALDSDTNKGSWRLMTVNGQEVDNPTYSYNFGALFTYPATMKLKIKTDLDAIDNTYRIIDRQGNVVKEFGPYANNLVDTYEETVELEPDQIYGFEVTDSWGDGVRHPLGSVKFYDTEGTLVAQIKEIDDWGCRQFFRTEGHNSVGNVTADSAPAEYYTLTGQRTQPTTPGLYIKRQGSAVTKVITHY